MDWQATDLNAVWRPAFMALVRQRQPADSSDVMRSIDEWNAMMLLLEQRLMMTGAFVTGDKFTVADVGLGLSLQRWLLTPMARPETPALLAYRERLQARPAAQHARGRLPLRHAVPGRGQAPDLTPHGSGRVMRIARCPPS